LHQAGAKLTNKKVHGLHQAHQQKMHGTPDADLAPVRVALQRLNVATTYLLNSNDTSYSGYTPALEVSSSTP